MAATYLPRLYLSRPLLLRQSTQRRGSAQALLEPVLGVGVVVVAWDLAITGGAVQAESLGERSIGIEADGAQLARGRGTLELRQEAAPEAKAAHPRRQPHALDLPYPGLEGADYTAADRLAEKPCEQHAPGRRQKLLRGRRIVGMQLESIREARRELGVIPLQTALGLGA